MSESKKTETKDAAPKSTTLTKGKAKVTTSNPTTVTQLKSEGWVVGK